MTRTSKLTGLVAGLTLSAGCFAATPVETNLGPAMVTAGQSTIFGETEAERRRNRALTIAGVAGALLIGAVLLDDDGDDEVEIEPPVHVPPSHH